MVPVIEKVINYGHAGRLSYKFFFFRKALTGILRKHRVLNGPRRYGLDRNFTFSHGTMRKWKKLFNVPDGIEVPFTVYSHAGAVAMLRIMSDLKINFRHTLHLKSEIRFHRPLEPCETYEIHYTFEEVMRIKHEKAALRGTSAIKKNGMVFLETIDHFVIKEVPQKYAGRLRMDESGQFRGITRIPAEPVKDGLSMEIFIPGSLPIRYAVLSGDYNIVHIFPATVKMFGYEETFLQGLCTANLIMSELCRAGIRPAFFSIVFCRPVYTGRQVTLWYNSMEYRLLNEEGKVLSFGRLTAPQ